MVNKALLRDVMDHIEKLHETNPVRNRLTSGDYWLQTTWHFQVRDTEGEDCGTAACFAGWALIRSGYQVDGNWCLSPEGIDGSVSDAAAEELGLDNLMANRLFSGVNTIEDLRRIVDEYCE